MSNAASRSVSLDIRDVSQLKCGFSEAVSQFGCSYRGACSAPAWPKNGVVDFMNDGDGDLEAFSIPMCFCESPCEIKMVVGQNCERRTEF